MNKAIITIAPTGNVPTKASNPHTPITPDEIANDVHECYQAGASIVHIHARNSKGQPTTDINVYREIIQKIRQRCDIVVQVSTGARGGDLKERETCIELQPEMASLTTGSSNFAQSVNYNPPRFISHLAQKMLDYHVRPEVEIFDLSMIDNAKYLVRKGLLIDPLRFNLVLNVPGSLRGTAKNLMILKENLPQKCSWQVTAIGKSHQQLTALALLLGGDVRVGIEDVLELEKGRPVSNVELVQRVAALAKSFGRDIAGPQEARALLGLNSTAGGQ